MAGKMQLATEKFSIWWLQEVLLLALPRSIHGQRTHSWSTKIFAANIFVNTQGITEIYKNIVSQKFEAIQYEGVMAVA